jgi:hypothetical protein
MTLTASALGGYDDNLAADIGSGTGTVPTAAASGYTGYFDGALDYLYGNSDHSLRASASGNVRTFSDYLEDPAVGGTATVSGSTRLGRRHTLGGSQQIRYEPLFTSGSSYTSGLPLPPGVSGTVPTAGLLSRRSLSSLSSVSLDREWSRRDSTRLGYSYTTQQFEDDYGDNSFHRVVAEYRRTVSRAARVRAGYRYGRGDFTDYGGTTRPYREHTIDGGPEIETALSPRRRLGLSIGGGATYTETLSSVTGEDYDYWVPFGSVTATVDLTPTWSLAGGYSRGFSVLQGLTEEIYSTDTVFVRTGGPLAARTDLVIGGTFASGRTPTASGVEDDFDVYGASAVLRYGITRTVSATAGYYYYHHVYSNPAALPTGFPGEYDRNAVRVGITVWAPLLGAPAVPPLVGAR